MCRRAQGRCSDPNVLSASSPTFCFVLLTKAYSGGPQVALREANHTVLCTALCWPSEGERTSPPGLIAGVYGAYTGPLKSPWEIQSLIAANEVPAELCGLIQDSSYWERQ